MAQRKTKSVSSGRRSNSGNQGGRRKNSFSGGETGIKARANEIVSEITDGRSVIRRNLRGSSSSLLGVLGGGLALALIGRYLFRYYQGHPEIADYVRGSLDGVENRLRSFKGFKGIRGDDSLDVDARH